MPAKIALNNPQILTHQIQDQYVRKNFENIQKYFEAQNQLLNFKFFERVFNAEITGAKIAHGLGYIPLDILVTRMTGEGSVTVKYAEFTNEHVVLDVSGPCRIRFYVGTYPSFDTDEETSPTEEQEFQSAFEGAGESSKVVYHIETVPLTNTQRASGSYPSSTSTTLYMRSTDDIVVIDCSGGAQGIYLPRASEVTGRVLEFIKNDQTSTTATLYTLSSDEEFDPDGDQASTSLTLKTPGERVRVLSDGTSFFTLSREPIKLMNLSVNAQDGYPGQHQSVSQLVSTNFPATGDFGDLGSMSLSAGDWDISFVLLAFANGATVTSVSLGISSTSGNSTTGLDQGDNRLSFREPNANTPSGCTIASYRVSLTAETTYYAKVSSAYSVATPQYRGRMSARRIR